MSLRSHVCRWLIAATAAGLLLGAGTVRAEQVPADEPAFTAFVAERIRAESRGAIVTIKGPLTLSIGTLQANLDRIYAFCKTNANGCGKEIGTYVSGVAAIASRQNVQPTKAALRVAVRPADYMRRALREVNVPGPALVRPLAEGLVIVPVLDSPQTIRVLNDKDRAALGLTADQVFDIAIANTRSNMKPLMSAAKPATPGQFGTLKGDYYESSRLALIESWAPLAQAQGGVLIVATPSPDLILFAREDSAAAIDALRTLTRQLMARAPKPLSDALLRWGPKGWQLVR